jgi:hypothetical protein
MNNATLRTSAPKSANGAIHGNSSWLGKTWAIRDTDPSIAFLLPAGCSFRLVAADNASPPGFYRLEFDDHNMTPHWKGLGLVAVRGDEPSMPSLTNWRDGDDEVKTEYHGYLNLFRQRYLSESRIERLEGVIHVGNLPEIVRFYCVSGAQQNGKDWIVIDVLQSVRQNGTGHGDPW